MNMRRKLNIALTRFLVVALFAGLFLLSGCGGQSSSNPPSNPPTTPEAIPKQLYQVDLSNATNDCGASDPGILTLTVLPSMITATSYTLNLGAATPGPAAVAGDKMTFSIPIPVSGGTVTFKGDWTFTAARHTFSGTTDAVVNTTANPACTFIFASSGQHVDVTGQPVVTGAATVAATMKSVLPRAVPVGNWICWGDCTGITFVHRGVCFNQGLGPFFHYDVPAISSRNLTPETTAFRYSIHAAPDYGTAVQGALWDVANPNANPPYYGSVYDSGWWFERIQHNDPASFVNGVFGAFTGVWSLDDYSHSRPVTRYIDNPDGNLDGVKITTLNNTYYVIGDLYYWAQDGRSWAWYRSITNIFDGSDGVTCQNF
jgi:hypothetical protein